MKDSKKKPEETISFQAPDDTEIELAFGRGLQEMEREAEMQDAQEHPLEYYHECESLRRQLFEMQQNYEAKLSRTEVYYRTKIIDLKAAVFNISDMVEYVKNNFSLSSAKDFKTMCYRLFLSRGDRVDEETVNLLDGIDEAIRQREAKRENINFTSAEQVYINPHNVFNRAAEEQDEQ